MLHVEDLEFKCEEEDLDYETPAGVYFGRGGQRHHPKARTLDCELEKKI